MPRHALKPNSGLVLFRRLLCITVLLFAGQASADEFEQTYRNGVDAFERGSYDEALAYFLEARAMGMDEPTLQYNLGISYYKLGRYEEARQAFLETSRIPGLAPLAYYNLGLTSVRLGREDDAHAWFQRVLDTSDSPPLRALALTMLERGAVAIPEQIPAPLPWSGFVSAGVGYDSNVLLVSDSSVLRSTERDDQFLDVFAYASRRLPRGVNRFAFEFDGSANVLRYADLKDYDIGALRIGATMADEGGTWGRSGSAQLAYNYLHSNPFTRETLFSLKMNRSLSSGGLRLRYELGLINAMDGLFSYLDGQRQRIEARLTTLHHNAKLHLLYQFEINDRRDLRAPLFTSYSPIRNALRVMADIPLDDTLDLHTELQLVHSRYRESNQLAENDFKTRSDDRLDVVVRLGHTFENGAEISLEYLYTGNKASIARYEYDRHSFTLGLLGSY